MHNKGFLSKLNNSQSQSLEQHITENEYISIIDICDYVEQTYSLRYTILDMTEWLQKHHFSFKHSTLKPKSEKNSSQELFNKSLLEDSYSKKLTEFCHDINQPLTAIICYSRGCLHTLKNKLSYNGLINKLAPPLEHIAAQASQAAKMIHEMQDELDQGTLCADAAEIKILIQERLPLLEPDRPPFC